MAGTDTMLQQTSLINILFDSTKYMGWQHMDHIRLVGRMALASRHSLGLFVEEDSTLLHALSWLVALALLLSIGRAVAVLLNSLGSSRRPTRLKSSPPPRCTRSRRP